MSRLVFVHGSPGNSRDFAPLLEHLRVEAAILDRGYDETQNFLTSVSDVTSGDWLVGYSWGFSKILGLEGLSRAQGLILISPFLQTQQRKAGVIGIPVLSDLLLVIFRKRIIRDFAKACFAPAEASEEQLQALQRELTPRNLRQSVLEKAEFSPRPAKFAGPVLALIPGADQVTPALTQEQQIKDIFQQCRTLVYPGAGHALPWTHAEALAQDIKQFMNETKERRDETRI